MVDGSRGHSPPSLPLSHGAHDQHNEARRDRDRQFRFEISSQVSLLLSWQPRHPIFDLAYECGNGPQFFDLHRYPLGVTRGFGVRFPLVSRASCP
jgi:hypothetical protein